MFRDAKVRIYSTNIVPSLKILVSLCKNFTFVTFFKQKIPKAVKPPQSQITIYKNLFRIIVNIIKLL